MKSTLCAAGLAVVMLAMTGCGDDGPNYASPVMQVPHKSAAITIDPALADIIPVEKDGIMEGRAATGQFQLTLRFQNVGKYMENILIKTQFMELNGMPIEGDDNHTTIMQLEPTEIKPTIILSNSLKAEKYKVQIMRHNGGPPPEEE